MGNFGFFADSNGDRLYSDSDFAAYFADFIRNGVYAKCASSLQVTENHNMTLKVCSGVGFINGRWYRSNDDENITVAPADGTYSRYDRIVLRCDYAARSVYLFDIAGSPAASPVTPDLVRNGSFFDIALATVFVPQATVTIKQENISDTRGDNSVCGWVTGLVQQIDTSNLFAQFSAAWADFIAKLGTDDHVTITTEDVNAREQIKELNGFVPVSQMVRIL